MCMAHKTWSHPIDPHSNVQYGYSMIIAILHVGNLK